MLNKIKDLFKKKEVAFIPPTEEFIKEVKNTKIFLRNADPDFKILDSTSCF
jgi:hypothetical protein